MTPANEFNNPGLCSQEVSTLLCGSCFVNCDLHEDTLDNPDVIIPPLDPQDSHPDPSDPTTNPS